MMPGMRMRMFMQPDISLAAPQGFEPRYAAPEAAGLPMSEGATGEKSDVPMTEPKAGTGFHGWNCAHVVLLKKLCRRYPEQAG
jgi:hypothetical protein